LDFIIKYKNSLIPSFPLLLPLPRACAPLAVRAFYALSFLPLLPLLSLLPCAL